MRTGRRELIRDLNRTLVLNLVRERGALSRADVSRISGLSPSTVTAITASLLADGYLHDDDQPNAGSSGGAAIGRPATLLRVNPQAGHVVGIKVSSGSLTAAVTDLAAMPLAITSLERARTSDAESVAANFETVVERVLVRAKVARTDLLGIGIGVPGAVDPLTRRVTASPLREWAGLDLVGLLEERLGTTVLLDNDVNTLTVAEALFGAGRGLANFVVVTVGRGIGMGIVANGSIHRGSRGAAGEFGHVEAEPGGADCWCGRRGCLEAAAAEPALVGGVLEATGRRVEPDDLCALAAGDPRVAEILERAGRLVGRALASVATILDPERIVLSGEGVRLGEHYFDGVRVGLAERERKEAATELVIEPWGDDAWARGAATLVLRELFHPAHLRDEGAPTAMPVARTNTMRAPSGRGDRR